MGYFAVFMNTPAPPEYVSGEQPPLSMMRGGVRLFQLRDDHTEAGDRIVVYGLSLNQNPPTTKPWSNNHEMLIWLKGFAEAGDYYMSRLRKALED